MSIVCIACRETHRGKKCPDRRPRQANGRLEPWARKNDDLKLGAEMIRQFQEMIDRNAERRAV